MDLKINGKVAVITAASAGLGKKTLLTRWQPKAFMWCCLHVRRTN